MKVTCGLDVLLALRSLKVSLDRESDRVHAAMRWEADSVKYAALQAEARVYDSLVIILSKLTGVP